MNLETRQAYSEVNMFLDLIGKELADEIPIKLREFFKREMDKSYKPMINSDKLIIEKDLKRKTIAIIAGLNINYWCKDPEKKKELLEMYSNNEKIYQEKLREEYNLDNLFKNKKEETVVNERKLPLEMKKESILQKIISFIKNLINKNTK